jgi:hypothetical protein
MLVSETTINTNSLPEAMTAYIAEHLKDKKMDQALMVITGTGGITYEIKSAGKQYVFSGEGHFLQIKEAEAAGQEKE